MGTEIFVGVLLVFVVITVLKAVRVVPQGFEWTVERFGRYTHTLSPGLGFIIPWVDGIGRKINMMEQVMEVPGQDVITMDNAVVKVDGIVFFPVRDAAKAAAEGEREAAIREAEARERLAEAEARATEMVSTAIAQGDVQAINYFVAQKYVEALKEFAASPNQKLLMLPMETTGVLGSLAGIAELAKAVQDKAAPTSLPRA